MWKRAFSANPASEPPQFEGQAGGQLMNRWLEYDLVVLAVLVFGIAAVEFLAMTF
jgi:hypothetical protein